MDETKELVAGERQSAPPAEGQRAEAWRTKLEDLAQVLQRAGQDTLTLGGMALEGVLDLLGFERGFIFVSRHEARPVEDDGDAAPLEPLVSRARRAGSGNGAWISVRNPEFAVNRSVIRRAEASGQPIAVDDCLLRPTPESEEQHRAVLCIPFELVPGARGILYIDRSLGRGELGEADVLRLRAFSERCLLVLARAFAIEALEALRGRTDLTSRPGQAEGSRGTAEEDETAESEGGEIEPEDSPGFCGIVGADEKLHKVLGIVRKVKDSDLNICIFGESGTGKELLARAIHESSKRREKLFVAENCGAIPENLLESELFGHMKGAFTGADEDKKGLFELADGGTLFLDEIGDMSEGMQRKLLRVLQEGLIRPVGGKHTIKLDVRVLCASNRDLKVLVQKGSFRADLYYRLNVITLELPPLRERPNDIPLLVGHLAAAISKEEGVKKRFTQSAMKALTEHPWPGNIRELRNVLRRALITCPKRLIARKDVLELMGKVTAAPASGKNIDRDDKELVLRIPLCDSFNAIIEECERVVIQNALKQCAWNKSKVTKALKIPRQSLYNKIAKYKLERDWGLGGA